MQDCDESMLWCYNERIKDVVIGEVVISIGDYAFDTCVDLRSITLPKSLMQIDAYTIVVRFLIGE